MEEKETIEKDVDLLDDITKFTVLPPKRERNKEEEEPVSKGSRILSLVYVSIGAALALAYLVLAFVFGRRYDGFNSEKGYGILPILFSSLAGLFAAGSFVLFYLKKKNKKSLFSSLALSSSLSALLSLYFSYSLLCCCLYCFWYHHRILKEAKCKKEDCRKRHLRSLCLPSLPNWCHPLQSDFLLGKRNHAFGLRIQLLSFWLHRPLRTRKKRQYKPCHFPSHNRMGFILN